MNKFMVLVALTLSAPLFAFSVTKTTTAQGLFLQSNPYADFKDPYVTPQIEMITKELDALIASGVITANDFIPLNYEPGVLFLSFVDATNDALLQALGPDNKLNLKTESTGIADLDFLFKLIGATELKIDQYLSFEISIPTDVNPRGLALALELSPQVSWAEENGVFSMGGNEPLQRLPGNPALDRITIGWGDCPAGCINNAHRYYEVKWNGGLGQYQVNLIAQTGDDPSLRP
jgi:hypothetical protein